LDKGLASTRRELRKWWSEGVTEQELTARKEGMLGSYFVACRPPAASPIKFW